MNTLSPLLKGLITGVAMIITTLILYYAKAEVRFQYIIYAVYAGGIAWTLIAFSRTPAYTGRFPELFGQGFRCFIIIVLIMVAFTAVFSMTHPEFAEEASQYYIKELVKQKNRQIPEMVKDVIAFKKQFTTQLVSRSVFGYLMPGVIFTAAGAGLILLRRK